MSAVEADLERAMNEGFVQVNDDALAMGIGGATGRNNTQPYTFYPHIECWHKTYLHLKFQMNNDQTDLVGDGGIVPVGFVQVIGMRTPCRPDAAQYWLEDAPVGRRCLGLDVVVRHHRHTCNKYTISLHYIPH